MDYHAVSTSQKQADCIATENARDIMLSTQSGIANCTYISLQPEKSCLHTAGMSRKQGEWKHDHSAGGMCGRLLCLGHLCAVCQAVCVVSRGRCSALWGSTFETVSPRKAHKQQQELWFLIIPYRRVSPGGLALLGEYADPARSGCLHNCSQIERCCRNANTGWIFIRKCDHPHGHLPSFFFFFPFRNNSSTGWESVYLDCCGGNCWSG